MDFDMVPLSYAAYLEEDKQRTRLCMKLLDVIRNSVTTFKPSKSLAHITVLPEAPTVEIDIVVSGGGLKGYFMAGCSHILQYELEKQNVQIARIAGASAGAWVGLFMLTNFGAANWLETYYMSKDRPGMTIHEVYDDIYDWVMTCLPEDAYKICSGRLFISITEVTLFGFKNHMISEFTSNRDLYECCMASSTVPFLSLPGLMRTYRGMYVIDGGVTINTPIFRDGLRRQLVFRLSDISYPAQLLLNAKDHCIESLVVRGAILMSRFLQGGTSDSFAWLDTKEEARDYWLRSVIRRGIFWTSFSLASLWSYRWTYQHMVPLLKHPIVLELISSVRNTLATLDFKSFFSSLSFLEH